MFERSLSLIGVDNAHWRGRSIHHYLLGTLDRKLAAPVATDEIAFAVSALAGIEVDPQRCSPIEATLENQTSRPRGNR